MPKLERATLDILKLAPRDQNRMGYLESVGHSLSGHKESNLIEVTYTLNHSQVSLFRKLNKDILAYY